MSDTVSLHNHHWIPDWHLHEALIDVRPLAEEQIFVQMIQYALDHGLNVVGDVPRHVWLDMDRPEVRASRFYEPDQKYPARWLVESEWLTVPSIAPYKTIAIAAAYGLLPDRAAS